MFLFKAFFTALFSIISLFLLTKILGNKQISQMNLFDYVNGITIGSIAAVLAIADEQKEFLIVLVAMITYTFAAYLISILQIKSIKCRRFLSGKSVIIIENGTIYRKNLAKCRLDINDILTLARNQGYFNISEISYAVMENNGSISFLQKSYARPIRPTDMSLAPEEEKLVYNVVIDGKLMPDNLARTGNDEAWLRAQLKQQGYGGVCNIMLATIDYKNSLTVFPINNEKVYKNIFD